MPRVSHHYDGIAGRLCLKRARNECARCSTTGRGQAAHIIGRGRLSARNPLRYDQRNLCCLCVECHQALTVDPVAHEQFFALYCGDAELEQLKQEARQVKKYCDLDSLMSEYRAELSQ